MLLSRERERERRKDDEPNNVLVAVYCWEYTSNEIIYIF